MLNGNLELHDIRDVEGFCGRIIDRARLELSHQDNEDLWAYLIETTWELSLRFEPGDLKFSTYATHTLRRRLVDWQRRDGGRTRWQFADRTYERELPRFVEIDDQLPGSLSSPDSGTDGLRGLVGARSRQRARHLD